MPNFHAAATLAILAGLGSSAVQAGDAGDESRQAIRCAMVYKLMAEMPNLPEPDKNNLSQLSGRMVEIYMRENQDIANATTWRDEFVVEISKYSDGTDPDLMSRETAVCNALVTKEAQNDPNLVPVSPGQTR